MSLLVTAVGTQILEWISLAGKSKKEAPSATYAREERLPEIKRI